MNRKHVLELVTCRITSLVENNERQVKTPGKYKVTYGVLLGQFAIDNYAIESSVSRTSVQEIQNFQTYKIHLLQSHNHYQIFFLLKNVHFFKA